MIVNDLLSRQKKSNQIALKYGSRQITYSDWYKEAKDISIKINNNVSDNSKCIVIFLPNCINYAIAYFGILFSKKIVVPIGVQSKEIEIKSTLEYCEIDLVITNSKNIEYLAGILKRYQYKCKVLCIDTKETITINNNMDYIDKSFIEDEVAIMLHTSGTTSNPKRVMLTHNNLISNIKSNISSLTLTENDKVLIALPMFFGYCNTAQFLTHTYLGATMIILDNIFLPKKFFLTVQEEKITNFTGVPSMLLMLLKYRYYNKYDLSSLRYICFGGGFMPTEKLKKLILEFNSVGFVQTYGQTEASPRVTALLPRYSLKKIGSIGKSIPNVKVKVVNERNKEIDAYEIGEIVVRGENIMKGYFKRKELTNKVIIDNWLYTGDLGYYDEDGFLYITGRRKNIIISGGINIYPEEIEDILLQHPFVIDALVLGEEDDLLGEIPIAKIELEKDANKINIINIIRDFCWDKMAQYKVPQKFIIVDHVPKTYNGKTKRV